MNVSVIIINWNTLALLRQCLESIYAQTADLDFEVIVVDNGSADGSVEMVKNEFPQVKLIANERNRGFAAANNQGLEIARGKYVLLLNSDTIVLENAIEKTFNFCENHPVAAVVGCRVLNADRTLQPTCFMFPSLLNLVLSSTYLYKLFPRNRFFGRERMTWWQRDDIRPVEVVTGCYMMVRKNAMEKVGFLDENYFMYGEETDWCCRFKKAGWEILFTPEPEIIHLGGASSKKMKSEMILQLRGSILYFFKKHKNFCYYSLACFLISLFFLLRVPFWLARGLVSRSTRKSDFQTTGVYLTAAAKAARGWQALCFKRAN